MHWVLSSLSCFFSGSNYAKDVKGQIFPKLDMISCKSPGQLSAFRRLGCSLQCKGIYKQDTLNELGH